ncbi:MAG: MFS transporter [Bacillota bacterium]
MSEGGKAWAGMLAALRLIPGSVWTLGCVSLLMDTSSELIHSFLPVFLVSVLGAGTLTVGFIEGTAEALALVTKVFSGVVSDAVGRRKPLVLLGYGLAAATKPLFPLAGSVAAVIFARFTDRIGKGIREAPRDALIGDITPPRSSGASFGLRQALDTLGAIAGPLAAMGCMVLFANNLRAVFWVAVPPAFAAVALLAFGVREPAIGQEAQRAYSPIRRDLLMELGPAYWRIVAIGGVFTLARFSEAFLVLRARSVGVPLALIPLIMVVMNVVYALTAFPAGWRGDNMDRRRLLRLGLVCLAVADLTLANAVTPAMAYAGAAVWGLHMGLTQGLFAAMVSDAAPARLRGTAFGVFNLVSGAALLAASVLAGGLWQEFGPAATFYTGAGLSIVTMVGVGMVGRGK